MTDKYPHPIFRHYLEEEGDKPYYTMNSLAFYYEDMARKQKLIEDLAKAIAGYDITMTESLSSIEKRVADYVNAWDGQVDQLPETVNDLLTGWVKDGTVDMIIEDARLNLKADKAEVNELTVKLAETEEQLKPKTVNTGAIVTFIDDDGYSLFLDQWYKLCIEKGIRCSVAVTKTATGTSGRMSIPELQALKAEGFEILSHSASHPNFDTITEAQWDAECAESKDFIISNNLGDGAAIVYPNGFTAGVTAAKKEMIKRVTRKHYNYGVDALGGVNTLPVDNFEVFRQGMASTFEQLKARVDEAVTKNGWLIFLSHSQTGFDSVVYGQLIDYIQSLNLPILPFGEAEKIVGNSLSYGDKNTPNYFFASKNGAIQHSENNKIHNFTMNMNISNYPRDKVTITNLSNTQDTFLNRGGILHTYRGGHLQSYQIYFTVSRNVIYRREWLDNSTSWGDWYLLTGLVTKLSGANIMDAPISAYPKDITTRVNLTVVQDTSFSKGGTMDVYRGEVGQHYAILNQTGTGFMYKRFYTEQTASWSPWQRLDATNVRDTTNNPMDAALSTYPVNSETIVCVNSSNDTFLNGGGTMKVFRFSVDLYSYATFVPVNASIMYIRKPSGSGWGTWTKAGTV